MADRNNVVVTKAVWMKQAEEAKLKSEAEKAAAAKAAFEATFKDVDKSKPNPDPPSDSEDDDEAFDLSNKPIGPIDPSKFTAAGGGVAGGSACSPTTFIVTAKDSDGRKISNGGASIRVKVTPGVGVGGSEIDGIVKDQGDGSYTVTYVVPKRGNYMVNVECDGKPIMGSPFPVFFSAGSSTGGLLGVAPTTTFPNLVNANMPNMPNYAGSVSGAFTGSGLVGMIPGLVPGPSGGVILPGMGASLGEVCREFLNGLCFKTDCKFSHPAQSLLMSAIAATSTMGSVNQVPMAPSAAAMAAAQAIMAAQALQAHAAQVQAQSQSQSSKDSASASEKENKSDVLKKTVQVSNLSPLLTADQLKQLFGFCGSVVDCTITDSKHFAYIEYSKPEEASAALALNNIDLCGRPLNVEMAKSLPQKPTVSLASSSLPIMMQQAVAMQQMQFQQALLMQQTMTAQQAANRAATLKSATDLASARAAEISKMLNPDGLVNDERETGKKSRSQSPVARSRSNSKSPISYRRRHRSRSFSPSRHGDRKSRSPRRSRRRSRSFSPKVRHSRDYRSRSPARSHHYSSYDRWSHRDDSDRSRRRDSNRSRDYHVSSRRIKSRSPSPRERKSHRERSESPKQRLHRSSTRHSRSPGIRKGNRSSLRIDDEKKSRPRNRSRSKSVEDRRKSSKKSDERKGKEKRSDRKRSKSPSDRNMHQGGGRLSPLSSDENKPLCRKRSRSRSLDTKYRSQVREGDSGEFKDDDPKQQDQSRFADREVNRRTSSLSKDASNSKNRRRSRSKSLEDECNYGRERDGSTRKEKHKRRDRRRSRSVSAELESHSGRKLSRHREERNKDTHRRRSKSKSPKGTVHPKDDYARSNNEKPNLESSNHVKADDLSEGPEMSPRNLSVQKDDGTSFVVCTDNMESDNNRSKSSGPTVGESGFDCSDVAENPKSKVYDPKNFTRNGGIVGVPENLNDNEQGIEDLGAKHPTHSISETGAALVLDEVYAEDT